jgi:broad specificity phosphatase PhoE
MVYEVRRTLRFVAVRIAIEIVRKDLSMTKIILVRHGHVDGIMPERYRGRLELPLTAAGRQQAEATARRIHAAWRPAAVYTSPLGRTVATGEAIAAPFGLSVQPVAGLNDIDYGDWQGVTPAEARLLWPAEVATWYRTPHLASIPGGETLQVVLARVAGALHEILRRHSEAAIVLVAHDSVNRIILLHALDSPLSRYWHLKQEPCAINELDFADGDFFVRSVNETWHLQPA